MSDIADDISSLALQLYKACMTAGLTTTAAESCTGGLLCAAITEIAGASSIFQRGYVTYSNAAKTEMLDVDVSLIDSYGAVSAQVAKEMAQNALNRAKADIAISITGIAGPTGDTPTKPIGLVYISIAAQSRCDVKEYNFGALTRFGVRQKSVEAALKDALLFLDRSGHTATAAS